MKPKHNEEDDANKKGLSADEVLAMMPKTDKDLRREKRKKATKRMARMDARRAKLAGELECSFEIVE